MPPKTPSRKQKNPEVDPLPTPNYDAWPMVRLYDLVEDGTIDLDPEYQRDVVWSEPRQRELIDSIFDLVYVPPIILATAEEGDMDQEENGNPANAVVLDGKQRLSSLRAFMQGDIYWEDPKDKTQWFYEHDQGELGKKQAILPKRLQELFANERTFLVVRYPYLNDAQQRKIFDRVQKGQPLTAAERLQATGGEWSNWIRHLIDKYVDAGIIAKNDPAREGYGWHPRVANLKRGNQFSTMAQIVMNLLLSTPKDALHRSPDYVKKHLLQERGEPPSSAHKKKAYRVLDRVSKLYSISSHGKKTPKKYTEKGYPYEFEMHTPHQVFTATKKCAPIEIVWIPVLVDRFFDCSDGQLLEIIFEFRKAVGTKYTGNVKTNGSVAGFMKQFIMNFDRNQLMGKFFDNGKFNKAYKNQLEDKSRSDEDELLDDTQLSRSNGRAKANANGTSSNGPTKRRISAPNGGDSGRAKRARLDEDYDFD